MKERKLRNIIREELKELLVERDIITLIKNLFGKLNPGQILIREIPRSRVREIFQFIDIKESSKTSLDVKVFRLGNINKNINNEWSADFIYNRESANIVKIKKDTYRIPTRNEKKLIKKAITSGEYDKYINKAESVTGLKIKI